MQTMIRAAEVPMSIREAAGRLLAGPTDARVWRPVGAVNQNTDRAIIYARKHGACVRYSTVMILREAACYGDASCTAPAMVVRMRYRDEPEFASVKLCGPHAREAMQLGFRFDVLFGRMNIRGFLPELDRYVDGLGNLSADHWTEIQTAPREWCDTGCKIHAKRHDNGVSVWIMHSKTYGCPVGT